MTWWPEDPDDTNERTIVLDWDETVRIYRAAIERHRTIFRSLEEPRDQ